MMGRMTITHVHLLSVPVTDQDRARDFYVDTLGLELVDESPMGPDQRWVQVAPKGSATGLTLVTWFPTMPAGSLKGLVLQTPDIDGETERLRRAGVEVTGPEDAPWGRFSTFDDPDGNGIVLSGPPSA
jgi:catechol 2,3-dioxygenase-like lactoylglutathione lyase family enzyme